jgi:peptide/nickel transport system substrate-binding protein
MQRKVILGLLLFTLFVLPLLAACAQQATPTPTATTPKPTAQANWWDKYGEPKYGGTITVRVPSLNSNFDPWYAGPFAGPLQQYESACWEDWTLDRNIWPFLGSYVPDEYCTGALAKSWEMPDAQTLILHLRQGVHFQDMPPLNGRELTASDFEYQYNRMFGIGGGFTKPSPYWLTQSGYIEQVTATDKYTVTIKFKKASALNLHVILQPGQFNYVAPREVVELSKDFLITDWKIAAGTGAWMVTDFVSDTSVTFSKNPNYWGYDERHPQNRLPYADTLKILKIPDIATALAALRTGKIDFMADVNWQQAASIANTNPELLQAKLPSAGATVDFRCDKVPFTDINVRKALQMAIDRATIARTHYGGTVDGKPAGLVSPAYKGWCTPYDEWPQELKDEYSYNPTRAKQLLAEAGYPDGFKTDVVTASAGPNVDLDLLQVIKAQFLDIGVDMEIKTMEPAAFSPYAIAGKQDQMTFSGKTGVTFEPWVALDYRSRIPTNYSFNKDAVYDAMISNLETVTDPAEIQRLIIEADMYALQHHWGLQVCPIVTYTLYQPYLKGYSGEAVQMRTFQHYARWWIDQDMKTKMGR